MENQNNQAATPSTSRVANATSSQNNETPRVNVTDIINELSAEDRAAYFDNANPRHDYVHRAVTAKFAEAFPEKPEEKPAQAESILGGKVEQEQREEPQAAEPITATMGLDGVPEPATDEDRQLIALLKLEYRDAASEAYRRASAAVARLGLTSEQIDEFVAGMSTQEKMQWFKRLVDIGG